jgi:hypothetical protein
MEQKENTIVIFKNNKKLNDKHPDYTGKVNVDGVTKDISLWVKEGKSGKFFSGLVKEEWKPNNHSTQAEQKNTGDLPF